MVCDLGSRCIFEICCQTNRIDLIVIEMLRYDADLVLIDLVGDLRRTEFF